RIPDVAQEFHLRDRIESARRSRIPDHEHQLVLGGAGGTPLQVIRGAVRLPVSINTEQSQIEVIPRIRKIVGISAKEGDVTLGRHHQPDVVEPEVAGNRIDTSLIQADDLAIELRGLIALGLYLTYHRSALSRL